MLIPAQPNLAVELEANPSREPLQAGDTIELRAAFRNDGAAPALGVTLTHRLSPNMIAALVANDNGVFSGDEVEFDLGDVPPLTTGLRRFTARLVSVFDPCGPSLQDNCQRPPLEWRQSGQNRDPRPRPQRTCRDTARPPALICRARPS